MQIRQGSRSASPFSGRLGRTGSGVQAAVSDENRCSPGLNVGHGGGGRGERKGRGRGSPQNGISTGPLYLSLLLITAVSKHTPT